MFICFLSLFVSIQVYDAYVKVCSIIVLFGLNLERDGAVCYLERRIYHGILYFPDIIMG